MKVFLAGEGPDELGSWFEPAYHDAVAPQGVLKALLHRVAAAVEELEAWVLAMHGERGSEHHADAKSVLERRHGVRRREEMLTVIEACDFSRLPDDSSSPLAWLAMARGVFGSSAADASATA